MYRALIKILGKCRDNLSAFKRVLDFVTQISLARMQCSGQREFLCLLYELSYRNPACAELTLDSLAQIISSRPQTELFILNGGKQAGIAVSVLRPGSVPAGGYGVFGWLRTERTDQTQTICEAKSMTVFKLAADKGADVELFLENGVFNYAVFGGGDNKMIGAEHCEQGDEGEDLLRPQVDRGGQVALHRVLPRELG